ncbi:MAG: hypothetical protein V4631_04740 [Pseudomonadota bacterium]
MNRALRYSILLSVLLSAACVAAEPGVCKSICAEERRACRSEALRMTQLDEAPGLLEMPAGNRDTKALSKLQTTPQQAQGDRRSAFQKRRSEREGACDSKALSCTRSCSAAPDKPSDILLKPKTQQ